MDGRPGFAPIQPDRTDEFVCFHAAHTVKKHKAALVHLFRKIVSSPQLKEGVDLSSVSGSQLRDVVLHRGVASGEDVQTVFANLFGQWNTSPTHYPRTPLLLSVEFQLFRCLLVENDAVSRIQVLCLWMAVVAVLGMEMSVRRMMPVVHRAGLHMASPVCSPHTSLEALYKQQRRHHDNANLNWDAVMHCVFVARHFFGNVRSDLRGCLLHPVYGCGEVSQDGGCDWKEGQYSTQLGEVVLSPGRFDSSGRQDPEGFARTVRNERAVGLQGWYREVNKGGTSGKKDHQVFINEMTGAVNVVVID